MIKNSADNIREKLYKGSSLQKVKGERVIGYYKCVNHASKVCKIIGSGMIAQLFFTAFFFSFFEQYHKIYSIFITLDLLMVVVWPLTANRASKYINNKDNIEFIEWIIQDEMSRIVKEKQYETIKAIIDDFDSTTFTFVVKKYPIISIVTLCITLLPTLISGDFGQEIQRLYAGFLVVLLPSFYAFYQWAFIPERIVLQRSKKMKMLYI